MQWMRRTDLSVPCSGLLRRVVRNLSIQLREHLPCSPNKINLCTNVYSLNNILVGTSLLLHAVEWSELEDRRTCQRESKVIGLSAFPASKSATRKSTAFNNLPTTHSALSYIGALANCEE